jgi:cysteinyl-tRNA synthetase
MIKLYNSLTRKIEKFTPISKGRVSLYACGPTVYHYVHIGNLRKFIFDDLLKRLFELNGYQVYSVMNITDVGHLVSDADEGEDKLEKGAKRENKTAWEVAEFFTKSFFEDLAKLNIKPFNHYPKATEYIKEQIQLIKKLEKNGFTYQINDGIYFDTSKLSTYGKLSNLKHSNIQAGARVEIGQKKNPTDFALWKFSPKDTQRDMEWDTPWGKGFPGWHTECVVMGDNLLHAPFDIHTGGKDHMETHHPNEIAQFEALNNEPHAHYWLHSYFLTFQGTKISKSDDTFQTLRDLENSNIDPLAFRLLILQGHYRSDLDFTPASIQQAQKTLEKLQDFTLRINTLKHKKNPEVINKIKIFKKEFKNALNNDLDTPLAMAKLFGLVKDINRLIDNKTHLPKRHIVKTLIWADRFVGLDLIAPPTIIPNEITLLAEKRQAAKQKKDWQVADQLRAEILAQGYTINDTPTSYNITPLKN